MSAPTYECGGYTNLTATANVSPAPKAILGFLVNSTNAGTIQFYDSATTTTTTPITGVITPAAGAFIPVKAYAVNGIYAVINGTELNVTIITA
jgi:hypothetical protein